MNRFARYTVYACVVFILVYATAAVSQPQTVPKLTERELDKASYVALAKEWKAYIEKNGESAEALYNLGMAYYYSHEIEAARRAAERAVEIEPYNAKALAFAAKMLVKEGKRMDEAEALLERSRAVAPDYMEGLTSLAVIYILRGELERSEEVFRTIFDQRTIYEPLQDYAYNMLVGLPHGAVLITNGDNDTFPPLALQAGMNFRNDVIVINRHLLGIEAFAEALFNRHPSIRPESSVPEVKKKKRAAALLAKMVDEQKAPIYFAATVAINDLGFSPELTVEGINRRSAKSGLTTEEAARLFFDRYRLDSATDWNFAWDLVPNIVGIMRNYVIGMIELAQHDDARVETRDKLLAKAMDIATFHDMQSELRMIRSMQKK